MAARLHKPLLAIVGGQDSVVPPAEGLAIYHAAAGPKQLLEIPAAGHVGGYQAATAVYEARVLGCLAANMNA